MKSIAKFLTDVRVELSRVEWPTFNDFVGNTIVVLTIVVVFAIFFGLVDNCLLSIAGYIFSLGK